MGADVQRFIDEHGEGLYAAAFLVDDIQAKYEELRAAGVEVGEPAPVPAETGVDAELLKPEVKHGALIEFVELGGGSAGGGQ
jgi:hypothetical protein